MKRATTFLALALSATSALSAQAAGYKVVEVTDGGSVTGKVAFTGTDPDPKIFASLPEELRDLPFGSPEFKDANEAIAQADMDACAETMRAMPTWVNLTGTTVCNLKCFMCNQFLDPDSPKVTMDEDVYQKVEEDPWGTDYYLERDGNKIKVWSWGPDGQEGTEDDISYPEDDDE